MKFLNFLLLLLIDLGCCFLFVIVKVRLILDCEFRRFGKVLVELFVLYRLDLG